MRPESIFGTHEPNEMGGFVGSVDFMSFLLHFWWLSPHPSLKSVVHRLLCIILKTLYIQ